jgi:hypothetical protein
MEELSWFLLMALYSMPINHRRFLAFDRERTLIAEENRHGKMLLRYGELLIGVLSVSFGIIERTHRRDLMQ